MMVFAKATPGLDGPTPVISNARCSCAWGKQVQVTLKLEPLHRPLAADHAHGQAVGIVENELANPEVTLIYVNSRGQAEPFHQVMLFHRPIGTLPARHLFALKWLRICDHLGLLEALDRAGYTRYLSQSYTGIMHGDGRATVRFVSKREGGSWWEENLPSIQAKCLDHFTPHFDDVFMSVIDNVHNYLEAWPRSPVAEFARRHVGGGAAGWATSR